MAKKKFHAKMSCWQSGFTQNPRLGQMKDGQREENGLQLQRRCSRALSQQLKLMLFGAFARHLHISKEKRPLKCFFQGDTAECGEHSNQNLLSDAKRQEARIKAAAPLI